MKNANSGRRAWRGATTVLASVLALSICAQPIVNGFRTDIDKFLGTKSTKLVTESTDGVDLYTYKSDYSSTTELLQAIQDLGERMNEEGTVLLKNNGALPLSADEMSKVSLLGFSSYFPVQGGDMGSSLAVNEGTDADTIDFVGALAAKGYTINPTLHGSRCTPLLPCRRASSLRSSPGAAPRLTTASLLPPPPATSPARSLLRQQ